MKTPALLMICTLFAFVSNSLAQELPKATKRGNTTYYYAVYFKYRPGKADEARRMAAEHFVPVDEEIGREVIGFDFMTGDWDGVVFFPLEEGASALEWEVSPSDERWYAKYAERAGGLAKAREIDQRWYDLIADTKTELVMRTAD